MSKPIHGPVQDLCEETHEHIGRPFPRRPIGWLCNDAMPAVPLGLQRVFRIGRRLDCELVLCSAAVSRVHAVIERRGDELLLRDAGSSNGTLLDGEGLPPGEVRPLRSGDVVLIGPFAFVFRTDPTAPGPAGQGPSAMQGRLAEQVLPEVLRSLELHACSGGLVVTGPDGRRGYLLVRRGVPVAATWGDLRDEPAVRAMLALREGAFQLLPAEGAAVERTMRATLGELLTAAEGRARACGPSVRVEAQQEPQDAPGRRGRRQGRLGHQGLTPGGRDPDRTRTGRAGESSPHETDLHRLSTRRPRRDRDVHRTANTARPALPIARIKPFQKRACARDPVRIPSPSPARSGSRRQPKRRRRGAPVGGRDGPEGSGGSPGDRVRAPRRSHEPGPLDPRSCEVGDEAGNPRRARRTSATRTAPSGALRNFEGHDARACPGVQGQGSRGRRLTAARPVPKGAGDRRRRAGGVTRARATSTGGIVPGPGSEDPRRRRSKALEGREAQESSDRRPEGRPEGGANGLAGGTRLRSRRSPGPGMSPVEAFGGGRERSGGATRAIAKGRPCRGGNQATAQPRGRRGNRRKRRGDRIPPPGWTTAGEQAAPRGAGDSCEGKALKGDRSPRMAVA